MVFTVGEGGCGEALSLRSKGWEWRSLFAKGTPFKG